MLKLYNSTRRVARPKKVRWCKSTQIALQLRKNKDNDSE